jgi:hypothetical protein
MRETTVGRPPRPEPQQAAECSAEARATVTDLLFTLEVCQRALPADAHPVHWERLRRIRHLVEAASR